MNRLSAEANAILVTLILCALYVTGAYWPLGICLAIRYAAVFLVDDGLNVYLIPWMLRALYQNAVA